MDLVCDITRDRLACEHNELDLLLYVLELRLAVSYFENNAVYLREKLSCLRIVDKIGGIIDLDVLDLILEILNRVTRTENENGLNIRTVNLKVSRSSFSRINITVVKSSDFS